MKRNITKNKFLDKLSLNFNTKQLILGSLLGNGELKLTSDTKALFQFKHRFGLKEYGEWKSDFLVDIKSANSLIVHKTIGYGVTNKITFMSLEDERLFHLYNYLYNQDRLRVLRRWLNYLDSFGLLIWWLDDGSIIDSGKRGVLCTDHTPYESLLVLRRYLKITFDIDSNIVRHTATTSFRGPYFYRLYFSAFSFRRFLSLIAVSMKPSPSGIILPTMLFKFKLLYKDEKLQQRWISDLQDLMPHYKREIEILYEPDNSILQESNVLKFRSSGKDVFS